MWAAELMGQDRRSIFRRKAEEPSPIVLRYKPQSDMTAFELSTIIRFAGGLPGVISKKPQEYNALREALGSAFRHFEVDEATEVQAKIESALSDFVGKRITPSLKAEVVERLKKLVTA